MLKPDRWIREQAAAGMIEPFVPELVRNVHDVVRALGAIGANCAGNRPVISYGTSSYGYDLRLSPKEFLIFRHIPGTVMNPKRFNPQNLEPAPLHRDQDGEFFILPAHSYGLGVALERLKIPPYITCQFIGKSTYARIGVIANLTPGEAGWEGHLTLEFSNSSGADCRIYANEGVVQALFFEGEPCDTTYQDRAGKYQGQGEHVVMARV
jgi:dCTP deaminase